MVLVRILKPRTDSYFLFLLGGSLTWWYNIRIRNLVKSLYVSILKYSVTHAIVTYMDQLE